MLLIPLAAGRQVCSVPFLMLLELQASVMCAPRTKAAAWLGLFWEVESRLKKETIIS